MAAALALVITHLGTAVPAWAQDKTDVVTLGNGDRITGEIVTLSRGQLELKTDDAGTIEIEWEHIRAVESKRQLEVVTSDGRRVVGTLARGTDRVLTVVGIDGTTALPLTDVTGMAPVGRSFWRQLEGSISAGASYTQSSGIGQLNANGDLTFRRPAFVVRMIGSGTLTYEEASGDRDDRAATELAYVRYRGRSWFLSGATRFETNESLGIKLRSQVSGAAGWRAVNSNRAQLQLGAGLVGNDERGVDAEATQNLEGVLAFNSSYYSYDRPSTNIDASVQYYPSLSQWGRERVQADAYVRREVWKQFFVSFNVYFTFDSDPPNPAAAHRDFGVAISAGWSF